MATAYPGGLRKRGGLLDEFMAPDYSYLARRAELTPAQNTRGLVDYLRDEYPRIYGAGAGLLQSDPYETANAYGVFDPNRKAAFEAAQLAFPVGLALDVIPGIGALKRPAMAAGRFVAPKAGLLAEQYMVNTGGILPLDVYHGSPHTFPPTPRNSLGEFDASKIGTGEGAQAYGHGIYVAEAPAVAKGYQESLSKRQFLTKDGFFDPSKLEHLNVKATASKGDLDKAIELARKYGSPDSDYPDAAARAARDLQKLETLKAAGGIKQNTGNLYKVDLPDEKIAKMLDWDQPMSEQQMIAIYDKMQQTELAGFAKPFQDNFYERMNRGQPTTDGQDLFMELTKQLGGQKQVSDYLKSIDIPGIKYLDATSRSAGKGTRNFVVFPGEEKSMTILERNAQKAEELKRLQAGGLLAP